MKNLKFYAIITALIVALVITAIKCLDYNDAVKYYQMEKARQQKAIVTEAKEIARKVDENGIEQVLFDVTANKADNDKLSDRSATKGLIDTTAMALDIRTKQLQQIMVVKGTLEAENIRLKKQLDLNSRPFYTYSGQGLNLKFTPPNESDSTSVAIADFSADVGIKATQYWKRNWFLGSKKSILSVSSTNSKLFKINGAEYVEFEQEQPLFGLRIQAAGNYNPQTGSIGFGPAARIDIGRWSVQGNYTWYPESGRWRPSINANFDIVRF